jgi:hypothetical protein
MADPKDTDDLTKELLARYGIPALEEKETPKVADNASVNAPAVAASESADGEFDNPFLTKKWTERKVETPGHIERALPGAAVGAGIGYASSGAGFNPLSPSAKTVSGSPFVPFVEKAAGIPKGDIAAAYELMKPAPATLESAAQTVAQNRVGVPTPPQTQRILGGTLDETHGTTGRQRMGFNAETQRQSRVQSETEALLNKMRHRGVVPPGDPIAAAGPMTRTAGGLEIPVAAANRIGAEETARAAAQAAAQAQQTQAATQQAASKVKMAAPIAGGLSTFGRVAAGAGAGLGALDVYNRIKEGDYPGAAISGITAAASIPFPIMASAIGLPIQWVYDNPDKARELYHQATSKLMGAQYGAPAPGQAQAPM